MNRRRIALTIAALFGLLVVYFFAPLVYSLLRHVLRSYAEQMDVVKGSALVVAIAALVVAWNNFRRGNTAIVKPVKIRFGGSQMVGVNNAKFFHSFEVELKNIGIPLRNAAVGLHGFTRLGAQSQPIPKMKDDQRVPNDGTLEKGMVAKFVLRSFEMDQLAKGFIKELIDPNVTRVAIAVYSDNSMVAKFHLRPKGWRRRFVRAWNHMAWRVNEWFAYDVERWGRKFHSRPEVVPSLRDGELHNFAQAVAHELGGVEGDTSVPLFPTGVPMPGRS